MSLITRCPACATMFKVVPDQLRISEGWVRCGQCEVVFDAHAQLQTPADGVLVPPPPHTPSVPNTLNTSSTSSTASPSGAPNASNPPLGAASAAHVVAPVASPVASSAAPPALTSAAIAPPSALAPRQPPAAAAEEVHAGFEETVFLPLPTASAAASRVKGQALPTPAVNAEADSMFPESRFGDTALPQEEQEQIKLSFMRKKTARSAAHVWAVRLVLSVVALLLGAALLLQVTLHERNRIAAMRVTPPAFLVSLCGLFHCDITPLRQIESVVIDQSSFSKIDANQYTLHFTLKNNSALVVAVPAVELTLTDAQDQVRVRRVLWARDWNAKQLRLLAGEEMVASVSLAVQAGQEVGVFSGYRLLAFYP